VTSNENLITNCPKGKSGVILSDYSSEYSWPELDGNGNGINRNGSRGCRKRLSELLFSASNVYINEL
jgi:hypothetical protein